MRAASVPWERRCVQLTAARCCCREELQQPVFMAIDALEFPELHDESIPAMAFIRHLTKLLQAAGVRDFSLKVRRAPSGTIRCLTAAVHAVPAIQQGRATLRADAFLVHPRPLPPCHLRCAAAGSVQA